MKELRLHPSQAPGALHLARFLRDVGYHCSFAQTLIHPMHLAVNIGGIPHLAKN
jgi:hypothetical protein